MPMKRNKYFSFLFCLIFLPLLLGCGVEEERDILYKNSDFGFTIDYPVDYQGKEIKWINDQIGIDLRNKNGAITIQAMGAGTNYESMPFAEYVKIAPTVEIQNYNKLTSIESFVSDYGVKGYKTYWSITKHEDTDKGSIDTAEQVGPIYYFPPWRLKKLGDQPVKTIMLSFFAADGNKKALAGDTEEIARSFRYLHSYKVLFNKSHHGKKYFVEKGKPFKIKLVSNPTTGYNWFLDELDESCFRIKSSGFTPSSSKAMGAPGQSYWEIIPLKAGTSKISLLYYRSWEGKEKAVDHYQFKVIIK